MFPQSAEKHNQLSSSLSSSSKQSNWSISTIKEEDLKSPKEGDDEIPLRSRNNSTIIVE